MNKAILNKLSFLLLFFMMVNGGAWGQEHLNLIHKVFEEEVRFKSNKYKSVYMEYVTFKNGIGFRNDSVLSNLTFWNIKLGNDADFSNCKFDNAVIYKIQNINNTHNELKLTYNSFRTLEFFRLDSLALSLFSSEIKESLILRECVLNNINLYFVDLPNKIILINVDVENEIDFTDANLYSDLVNNGKYKRHDIYIENTDISKIRMDYTHFKLIDTWDTWDRYLSIPRNEMILNYEALLKNFKDHGQLEDYQLLDIEFRQYKDKSWRKWQSCINNWWWGFGYQKEKVMNHAFLFLGIFIVLVFCFLKWLQQNVYTIDGIHLAEQKDVYIYRSIGKRLWYSIVYASVVFLLLTLKVDKVNFSSKPLQILGTIFLFIMHISGLLCLAYIAGMVLQR